MNYLQLGASLYAPATRHDLAAIGNRRRFPKLRSVIFCLEDAVCERDLSSALRRLEAALRSFEPTDMLRFVRARNPAVLRTLLGFTGIERLDGFVLPKVTPANVEEYFSILQPHDHFRLMLTLETREVFDGGKMALLRDLLLAEERSRRVLALRIGGNDLFQLLGLRRPRGRTIYETPLGGVIGELVTTFKPYGIPLTAPVFEWIGGAEFLRREVESDIAYGLLSKTAIHPDQIPLIEAQYAVRPCELEMAERILDAASPPVFRLHDAMCERATHHRWAAAIRQRHAIYGLKEE